MNAFAVTVVCLVLLQFASAFNVRILNAKKNMDMTIDVPAGAYVLDHIESQGIQGLPYSCRAGACSSCLGKVPAGQEMDQSGNIFLSDAQIDEGYVLTCIASPIMDVDITIDIEREFYADNPDLKVGEE